MLNALKNIFDRHKGERVCVVGTMCCGKTTLCRHLPEYNCIDMDDEFWHQVSEEELKVLSKTPITKSILDRIFELVHEKVAVKPGFPLFGVVILDCEAVVYMNISEKLPEAHCKSRGDTDLADALFVKRYIESDLQRHKAKNDKAFTI